jgi:hypothetical protein
MQGAAERTYGRPDGAVRAPCDRHYAQRVFSSRVTESLGKAR